MGLKALTNYLRQLRLITIIAISLLHFYSEHTAFFFRYRVDEYSFDCVPVSVTTQKKQLILFSKAFLHSRSTVSALHKRTDGKNQSNQLLK